MSAAKHTLGPWRLNWNIAGGGQHAEFPDLHYVGIEGGEYGADPDQRPLRLVGYVRKPDAYLLAAAPDLLAALVELEDAASVSSDSRVEAARRKARAAIAKAEQS